jgi:predicted GTPase
MPSTAPLNFIVFGEMGVGKSSLINLVAGKTLAKSSAGLKSCTLESTEYTIVSSEPQLNIKLFDTVGLNNTTMNDKSYLDALVKAHKLVTSLQNQGGVHGLLFCIKGGNRILDSTQQNYRLFHEFLCQKKVPLALVITNLENEENMDDWWTNNQRDIKEYGIDPVTQVCITTIKGLRNVYEDKYLESRKKVCDMLATFGRGDACSVDINWFARMCNRLRHFFIPGKALGKSREKMLQTLTKRCKLPKQDAMQLLQRIELDEEN